VPENRLGSFRRCFRRTGRLPPRGLFRHRNAELELPRRCGLWCGCGHDPRSACAVAVWATRGSRDVQRSDRRGRDSFRERPLRPPGKGRRFDGRRRIALIRRGGGRSMSAIRRSRRSATIFRRPRDGNTTRAIPGTTWPRRRGGPCAIFAKRPASAANPRHSLLLANVPDSKTDTRACAERPYGRARRDRSTVWHTACYS